MHRTKLPPLPSYKLITGPHGWDACLAALQAEPRLAFDLEANSMFAYRESICLIQVSTPTQDYILDPLKLDLAPLGVIMADTAVEKIFHAAEYDLILMKREHGWELNNLFDTMWAARILGYPRYGLASLLEELYRVTLDKRFQKSNWCKRPLTHAQLSYAQLDTHYLLRLRDDLDRELHAAGHAREAAEIFHEQTQVKVNNNNHNAFDPDNFWSINGAYDLTQAQQAVLKALNVYRDQEARRRDQPLFKIFSDRTLLELARALPASRDALGEVHGMSHGQVQRYGRHLLQIITENKEAPAPNHPTRARRQPEAVITRYEKLHNWRKRRAQARGVESDVIISREALWEIARANPQNAAELCELPHVGAWRCETYGAEILALLRRR